MLSSSRGTLNPEIVGKPNSGTSDEESGDKGSSEKLPLLEMEGEGRGEYESRHPECLLLPPGEAGLELGEAGDERKGPSLGDVGLVPRLNREVASFSSSSSPSSKESLDASDTQLLEERLLAELGLKEPPSR